MNLPIKVDCVKRSLEALGRELRSGAPVMNSRPTQDPQDALRSCVSKVCHDAFSFAQWARCWCKESGEGVGLDFKSPGQISPFFKSQEHIQKVQELDATQIRNRKKCSIKLCDHEKCTLPWTW